MSSNENKSNPIPKSNPKAKRWFKRPSAFQNKASSSKRETSPPIPIASSSNSSNITSTTTTQPSSSTTMPSSTYAPSTYTTTSTTTTLKPLVAGSSPSRRSQSRGRSSKAWSKTKDFLSSLGEPPTAQYDREQMMKRGVEKQVKTDGKEAFGAINYGPYGAGATFNGRL